MLFDFYDHIKDDKELPTHFIEFVKDLSFDDSKLYYTFGSVHMDEAEDKEELHEVVDDLLEELKENLQNVDGISMSMTLQPMIKNEDGGLDKSSFISVVVMTLTFDFIDKLKEKLGVLHLDEYTEELIGETFKTICEKCHISLTGGSGGKEFAFKTIDSILDDAKKNHNVSPDTDLSNVTVSGELTDNILNERVRKYANNYSKFMVDTLYDMYSELYTIYKQNMEYKEWQKGVTEHVGDDENTLIMKTPASTFYFILDGFNLKN